MVAFSESPCNFFGARWQKYRGPPTVFKEVLMEEVVISLLGCHRTRMALVSVFIERRFDTLMLGLIEKLHSEQPAANVAVAPSISR